MYLNFCLYPPLWYKHLYSLTRIRLLQLKISYIWLKFFWNQKVFHFGKNEILTLKSLYELFLIKLSPDISYSSFVLDSLSKAKIFRNFAASNTFLLFKRFWNVRLSDRCHFIASFLAWKKRIQLFLIFPFYIIKINVFDKS